MAKRLGNIKGDSRDGLLVYEFSCIMTDLLLIAVSAFLGSKRSSSTGPAAWTDARNTRPPDPRSTWARVAARMCICGCHARAHFFPGGCARAVCHCSQFVNAALRSYRLPRWAGQETYAELWVEKQALAGVLSPLAREFHVTLMVNKGYSSSSAMYEAANRFNDKMDASNRVLFYLGDHDPSGEDMVRDIADRLYLFNAEVDVRKLALTMDQIREHNPPPNPAKISDARFATYSAKHGNQSWEVDALDPATLAGLVREAFSGVIDVEKMDAVKTKEKRDKDRLKKLIAETKWSKA